MGARFAILPTWLTRGLSRPPPAEVIVILGDQEAFGRIHPLMQPCGQCIHGCAVFGHFQALLNHVAVGPAEGPGVDDGDPFSAFHQFCGSHGAAVGAGEAVGHGDVQNLLTGKFLVEGGDFTDGRLAGGGHVALTDDIHELPGADLGKFPVGISGDGHRQGRNGEACLPGLGGGVEGRGIGNDTNHGMFSF